MSLGLILIVIGLILAFFVSSWLGLLFIVLGLVCLVVQVR